MKPNDFLNEVQGKFSELLKNSPAKDLEKNFKALLQQGFSKMDLVTRAEFDVQAQVLARTRAKLEALEQKIAALEAKDK